MLLALEYITVGGDLMRGTNMRGNVLDSALTFLVNYNLFVTVQQSVEPMEELTLKPQVKGV